MPERAVGGTRRAVNHRRAGRIRCDLARHDGKSVLVESNFDNRRRVARTHGQRMNRNCCNDQAFHSDRILSVFRPAVLPDDAHIKAFPLSVIVIVVSNVCKEFVKSPDLVPVGRFLQPTCSNRRMRWPSTSISSKNILAGEEQSVRKCRRSHMRHSISNRNEVE